MVYGHQAISTKIIIWRDNMKNNLICRVSSVLLIICMLSSVLAIPAYAVESRQVVGRIQISATDYIA